MDLSRGSTIPNYNRLKSSKKIKNQEKSWFFEIPESVRMCYNPVLCRFGITAFGCRYAALGYNCTQEIKGVFKMYIDPNTGGMLFQILAVLFGVISGAILIFSSRIKMGFSKLRRSMRGKTDQVEMDESPLEENPEN